MIQRSKPEHLYVHVPFCKTICSYCDFVHSVYQSKLVDEWLDALQKEIESKDINPNLKTIYIGGGTPSCLSDEQLDSLLSLLDPYCNDVQEYRIDFKGLEEKLANPEVTLIMLCNPHNPVGKIWSRKDLEKIANLCAKYGVNIISDEIHCDLTNPNKKYIPFASVSNYDSITTISPTKSFNLAGLNTAAVYVVGDSLKKDIFNALDVEWVSRANIFAVTGVIAAYTKGRSLA